MPRAYADADTVEDMARQMLPTFHPELATARIKYILVDKGS